MPSRRLRLRLLLSLCWRSLRLTQTPWAIFVQCRICHSSKRFWSIQSMADQLHHQLNVQNLQSAYHCCWHSTETVLLRILNDLLSMPIARRRIQCTAGFARSELCFWHHWSCPHAQQVDYWHLLWWSFPYLVFFLFDWASRQGHIEKCRFTTGVPQESVLGPLILLYTRKLAELISNISMLYFLLYSSLPSDQSAAAAAIQNVEDCCSEIKLWMDKNKL